MSLCRGTGIVCLHGITNIEDSDSIFVGESYTSYSPNKSINYEKEKYVVTFSDGVSIECSADTRFESNGLLIKVEEIEVGTTVERVMKPLFGRVKYCYNNFMRKYGMVLGTCLIACNPEIKELSGFSCFKSLLDVLRSSDFEPSDYKLIIDRCGSIDLNSVDLSEAYMFGFGFEERRNLFNGILDTGVMSGTKNLLELRSENKRLLKGVVTLGRSVGYVCKYTDMCAIIYSDVNITIKSVYRCESECECISFNLYRCPTIIENYVKVY